MVRIAICDDCPQHIGKVSKLLSGYQAARPGLELRTDCFTAGGDLLDMLNAGQEFDLVLLDIMMPGENGIEVARRIRTRNDDLHIVFLTSSEDHALDAFGVQAAQYIVKPVKEDALFPALDRIIAALRREDNSFLIVSMTGRDVKIPFASIVYIESVQRELHISLTDGSKLHSKTIRAPFEDAVDPLLRDGRFLHARKSFVLNMSQVEELRGKSFIMKNGTELLIPKYRYAEAREKYMEYLSAQGIGRLGGAAF